MNIKKLITVFTTIVTITLFFIMNVNASDENREEMIKVNTYGGEHLDYFNNSIKTDDGGYLVTGATDRYEGDGDWDRDYSNRLSYASSVIVKFNKDMQEEWSRTYEDEFSYIHDLEKLPNDEYVVVGSKDNKPVVAKIDVEGNVLWIESRITSTQNESYTSVEATTDGGFIITGSIYQNEREKNFIKYDSSGKKVFVTTISDPQELYEHISIEEIIEVEGGYVAAGRYYNTYEDNSSDYQGIIVKLNESGETVWRKNHMLATDLVSTSDGKIVIVGYEGQLGYISKIDLNGEELWKQKYKVETLNTQFNSITEDSSGNLIVVGKLLLDTINYHHLKTDHVDDLWLKNKDIAIVNSIIVKYDVSGVMQFESKVDQKVIQSVIVDENQIVIVGYDFEIPDLNYVYNRLKVKSFDATYLKINELEIPRQTINQYKMPEQFGTQVSTYGGDYLDYFNNIVKTDDGGYFVTGMSDRLGRVKYNDIGSDYYWASPLLVKFDENMQEEWNKVYDDYYYYLFDLIKLKNGNFLLLGEPKDGHGAISVIDSTGSILWHNDSAGGYKNSVTATDDGGFIIRDHYVDRVIKYDAHYKKNWTKGLSLSSKVDKIIQIKDGYMGIGWDRVVKLDENGNIIWEKEIDLNPQDIIRTMDGNVAIVGYKSIKVSEKEGYYRVRTLIDERTYGVIVKIDDRTGKEIWTEKFGGNKDQKFVFQSVLEDPDGNLIVLGQMKNNHWVLTKHTDLKNLMYYAHYARIESNRVDTLIIKYNDKGKLEWESKINHAILSVLVDDQNYIGVGYTFNASLPQKHHRTLELSKFDAVYFKVNEDDLPKFTVDTFNETSVILFNAWVVVRMVLVYIGTLMFITLGFILLSPIGFVAQLYIRNKGAKIKLMSKNKDQLLLNLITDYGFKLLEGKREISVMKGDERIYKISRSMFWIVISYTRQTTSKLKGDQKVINSILKEVRNNK